MLIGIEGLPGTGKSTQAALLLTALRAASVAALCLPDLRSVTSDPIGDSLIAVFASSADPFLRHGDVLTDTHLAAAIRAHLDTMLLQPALAAHTVVVEDRGMHTLYSYSLATLLRDHHADPRAGITWLHEVGRFAGRTADHAVLLKLPVEEAIHRAARRDGRRYTPEECAFLRWVDQAYDELAARDQRLLPVDLTDLTPDEGHQAVMRALASRGVLPFARAGETPGRAST